MAKLFLTGQTEAIDLKHLHGEDVKLLDDRIDRIVENNGGFADILCELRRGVLTFLRIQESYPLKHESSKRLV